MEALGLILALGWGGGICPWFPHHLPRTKFAAYLKCSPFSFVPAGTHNSPSFHSDRDAPDQPPQAPGLVRLQEGPGWEVAPLLRGG